MNNDSAYLAGALAASVLMLLVALAIYAVSAFFLMKIFEKAGVDGRWRAWVPVYNMMIFYKLGDLSPWLILYGLGGTVLLGWIGIGFLFSIALAVFGAMAAYRIGLKLGKDPMWVILFVFASIVWTGILGLDKSRWNPLIPPAPWQGNSFLGDNTRWDGVPQQPKTQAQIIVEDVDGL